MLSVRRAGATPEDIITPMDVSIIGCVVNGPEALVSTLGVTGGNAEKSGLYEDGVRKDRLDNNDMIDQLEAPTVRKPVSWTKRVELTFSRLKKPIT